MMEITKLIGHNRSLSTLVVFGCRLSDPAGIAIADALDDASGTCVVTVVSHSAKRTMGGGARGDTNTAIVVVVMVVTAVVA